MSLSDKEWRLVDVVACMTRGDWEGLRNLRASAPAGEPDREWREAILQSHLFLGFPRVVEAFEQLATCGGTGPLDADEGAWESADWDAPGRELFDTIYAGLAEPVRRRLRGHHPNFATWIAEHSYGRVLARPGLAPHRRELLALVCLILQSLDRQLASHTRGAIRLGALPEQAQAIVERLKPYLLPAEFTRMAEVVARFSADA